MSRGRIVGVDHLGIAVSDSSESGEAFRKAFGLDPGHRETLPDHGVKTEFYPVGSMTEIEFIEPLDGENSIGKYLARKGSGIHHVALRVEDLDDLLEDMKARGIRLIDEAPRPGAQGKRIAFIHPRSVGGVLMELVEHPRSE